MLQWGGLEFHLSRERGRWARRLPHLPAAFKGNWRTEQGVGVEGLQGLCCKGDTGDSTPKVYPYI